MQICSITPVSYIATFILKKGVNLEKKRKSVRGNAWTLSGIKHQTTTLFLVSLCIKAYNTFRTDQKGVRFNNSLNVV